MIYYIFYTIIKTKLQQYVQKFDSKNIILNLGGVINAKIQMEKVKSNYNIRNGIISFSDIKSNIKIDTSTVYKMQVSENGTIFEIYLDDGLDLRIEK